MVKEQCSLLKIKERIFNDLGVIPVSNEKSLKQTGVDFLKFAAHDQGEN